MLNQKPCRPDPVSGPWRLGSRSPPRRFRRRRFWPATEVLPAAVGVRWLMPVRIRTSQHPAAPTLGGGDHLLTANPRNWRQS